MSKEELANCSFQDLWHVLGLVEKAHRKLKNSSLALVSNEKECYWPDREDTKKIFAVEMIYDLQLEQLGWFDGFKFEFSSLQELELKLAVFGV